MTKEELQKLKSNLPSGYRDILAEKHGLSKSYIDKIFSGERFNSNVIDSAIEMAEVYQNRLLNQKQKINSL
jgi:hypothetical protein